MLAVKMRIWEVALFTYKMEICKWTKNTQSVNYLNIQDDYKTPFTLLIQFTKIRVLDNGKLNR